VTTRTVTVRLRADISNYTRGMRQAANNTSRLAGAGAAVGTAMVAGFAVAAASAARFDKALSNVRAVTGASTAEMAKLRAAALDAGKTTSYTATEAADAEAELARAGVSVADITGGALKGSLALAASGQIDLSESATVAAQAMNTFGLAGKDVTHVADVLSAGANKSASDVHGLGMSLRMGGLLAHQTGLSLEQTVGTLSAFADHALIGSDAGTSLKVMLQRLVPQSKEAQAAMDAIGFSAYDSSGQFVGLSKLAGRMQTSFAKLTPEARNSAMATIFGADAVRSATILYELGSDGINKYVQAVNDQGAAGRNAAIQTDNLIGDLERLKGAVEVALIEGGSAANGSLRTMTQWITKLVDAYNSLPPGLQKTVTLFSGIGGAAALAGAGMLLLLPRIAATRAALVSMGVTAARARFALMALGRLGIVVTALAAIGYGVNKIVSQFQAAPPNITKMGNALVDFAQKGRASGELTKTFGKDLDGLGEAVKRIAHPSGLNRTKDFFSTFDVTFSKGDLDRAREKIQAIDQALADLVSAGATKEAATAFQRLAAEAEKSGTSTEKFRSLLTGYQTALAAADTQAKTTATSQGALGDAASMTADDMADQRTEAEKLTDALKTLNGVAIGVAEQEIAFRGSLADLTSAVKDNGHSLDITTEKGRNVKEAFLGAAKAAMEHAQAVAEQTGSVEAGNAAFESDIATLKRVMDAAGFNEKQIRQLTDAYAKLPGAANTQVGAPGATKAAQDLAVLRDRVMAVPPGKSITVKAPTGPAIKALEAAGYSVKRIPGSKNVKITAPTGTPVANALALKRALDALQSKSITITTTKLTIFRNVQRGGGSNQAAKNAAETNRAHGGPVRGYASGGELQYFPYGGYVEGPGTSTSDSILAAFASGATARVSDTEYVIQAPAVRKYGVAMFDQLNAMRFADGGLVGYARGGKAKRKPPKTPQSVINARRELPGDFGEFSRSLAKAASDIRTASNALIVDLKKLGTAGWRLAGQVDRTSRRLQGMATQRDKLRARIAEAREFADAQRGTAQEFMSPTRGQDAAALIEEMKARQQQAGQFQRDIRTLEKRGLNKNLLSQVIAEGPGGALAGKLVAANATEFQALNTLAAQGAKLASTIGTTTADAMYDAGKMASKGFLTGLISQEAALTKQMNKLGAQLVASIKRALKIKSPSQVMRDQVGKLVGAGLVQGMDHTLVDVRAAGARMSAAAVSAAWGRPPAGAVMGVAGGEFTGQLYLDSGVFLGAVRGTVQPLIRDSEQRQAYRAKVGRR